MPLVRPTFFALATLALWFAASQPAAALVNVPQIARAADPVIRVAGTRVEDMTPQMRTAYVRGIQEELAAHDYHPGPADGFMGPMTRGAIRHYQRDAGLEVDGVATKELLDHLKFALPKVYAKPPPEPDQVVLEAQIRLQELGYYRGPLDGQIGPETREAARAFRYDAGLPVSSSVDEDLIEWLSEPQPAPGQGDIPESADMADEVAPEPLPEGQEEPLIMAPPPAE
jgi:peptidoglycan hydrolase-like protein with peptidoglycan-binding domain